MHMSNKDFSPTYLKNCYNLIVKNQPYKLSKWFEQWLHIRKITGSLISIDTLDSWRVVS